jgi:hypothetical protein
MWVKPFPMGKLYWSVVVFVLVGGLTVALYFGLQGRSVPLIKWSHFSDAREVSDAIQSRMSQELQPYQIYFIGPHPLKPLHVQAALNIVEWLRGQGPSVVIADKLMVEQNPLVQNLKADLVLDLSREKARFLEGIKNISPESKVIVLAPNIYVTHFLPQSPVSEMREDLKGMKYIVLSFMTFPGSRDQEKDFEFPCRTSDSSADQLDLGCFILGQSRPQYLKTKIENKTPGFLNLVRSQEYMFFLGN